MRFIILLTYNDMEKDRIHLGMMIKGRFDEAGHKVAWLAKKIAYRRGNIYKIFARSSIDTALLLTISVALKKNFFEHLSAYFQEMTNGAEGKAESGYKASLKKLPIGELIMNKVHEEGLKIEWLAQKLECDRSNIYHIFSRHSIDAWQLMSISLALNTNFFEHFSELYKTMVGDVGLY